MTNKAWFKAGLIGAGVIFILTLLSQIPVVGCVCCGAIFLAYLGISALAGYFMPPRRNTGDAAVSGALAGLISGAVGGIVWAIVVAIQMAITGTGDIMAAIDPATLRQLAELGIDPETFAMLSGVGGVALVNGLCCLSSLALGAGFGAIGGAIFAAVRPE
ncbi:MAG TPA: hypothetical protein ENN19_10580 [Chloroflexi bacterium]|nr:hypothetical protein [Chloroflexota bacterium]